MRTTISKLKYVFFLLVIAGFVSCKGEIGPPGADGIDGIDGIDGTNGDDGTDGTNGSDGSDGNANVTTISLLASDITWTLDDYLGRPANVFTLDTSAVNQDIIDHGTVFGYCHFQYAPWDEWIAMPWHWENTGGNTMNVVHTYNLNIINLYAYETANEWIPNSVLPEYKFILITDNTVNKGISAEQSILNGLEQAGVDINNYYEVMDYYGLDY